MGDSHVDALPAERDALGLEQRALAPALGQRSIGADDPMPRDAVVAAGVEDRSRHARRARGHITVGAYEPLRRRSYGGEDLACAIGVHGG
jgi:hypothetical protein